jgi:phospholipid N-methyltransferase
MANFFVEFIKNPVNTSAIVPSSKKLARAIVGMAKLSKANVVVEFGPGTGVFTEQILKKLSKRAKFFALEINPKFVKHTKKRFPSAVVYHDTALNMRKYLKKHRARHCDCIISGLPFTVFNYELQKEFLKIIKDALSPGGRFLTFTYLHRRESKGNLRLKKLLKKNFDKLETSRVVWKNFPPAYVYSATKK